MKLGSAEVQMGKVLAIAALGVAGMGGVAACAAVQASSQPRPPSAAADSAGMARDIARIAVGTGGLDRR